MYFEPTATIEEAKIVLQRLAPIIDKPMLTRRAKELRARIDSEPIMHDYLSSKYAVELTIDRLFHRQRLTGRVPKKFRDRATVEAMSFAFALTRVHKRLALDAQIKLRQRLYGSLKGESSLAPIVHEMMVAIHLMNRGWDVEFHDLECGGFEYIARQEGKEIEIECKRVGVDAGRKIHRNDFYRLANQLLPELEQFARRRVADIVHLQVMDRLPRRNEELAQIRQGTQNAMDTATATNEIHSR